jgi:hypothetical protein
MILRNADVEFVSKLQIIFVCVCVGLWFELDFMLAKNGSAVGAKPPAQRIFKGILFSHMKKKISYCSNYTIVKLQC